MMQPLSDDMLEEVSEHLAAQMGLHFPRSKWRTLEQAFCRAARELDFQDAMECAAWFVSTSPSDELMEAMAGYLTVGETYFLRENRSLEIMAEEIIPELIRTRRGGERRLRIWSAGCATGEEPYSIAILLHRMRAILRDWDLSILATDINPHALRKAAAGIYTEWSFRAPPRWFREDYFHKTGDGRFELAPRIRQMVSFSCLNLAEDIYPALLNNTNAMDMIFCRNVLMYFTPERAEKVIERFRLCLVDGGWLFVSPCELSHSLSSRFAAVKFPDAIVYRKLEPGLGAQESPAANLKPTDPGYLPPPPVSRDIRTPAFVSKSPTFTLPAPVTATLPPSAPLSPYEETLALYEQGLYAQAAERLTAHLSADSGDAAAIALLCRIRANEGMLDEALRLSGQAIAADKLNAGLHYLRAVILQEQGDADEAVNALKRALYLDQELVLAHFSLGNLALRQGKGKEARRYFDNALTLLKRYRPEEIVPESEGMPAGRLMEILESTAGRVRPLHPENGRGAGIVPSETWRLTR